jgi:uncharacterized membrane protein YfcA
LDSKPPERKEAPAPAKKAGVLQVAVTILSALFAIRRKGAAEKDSATITLPQAVIGGVIGVVILVLALIMIVNFVVG